MKAIGNANANAKNLKSARKTRKNTSVKYRRNAKKGVLPLIAEVIDDIIQNGVTEKEVENAKKMIEGKNLIALENAETQVSHNGKEWLLHNDANVVPYKDVYSRHYKDIKHAKVNEVIKKYFKRDNLNVVMIGGNLPSNDDTWKALSPLI
jgi:predicted Zn-dependent peptidase